MPYARNADLPSAVRNPLPNAAQTLFRTVVNGQLNAGLSEERAFRSAWSAVGRQYKKPPTGGKWIHKRAGTLYVRRIVENADEIIKWAKSQGFETTQASSSLHATIIYSKESVEWPEPDDDVVTVRSHTKRAVEPLGEDGAVVLKFESPTLSRRWAELCEMGCSCDYDTYTPHVTITWKADDLDLTKVEPYTGPIVLGPEVFEPVDEDWRDNAPIEKLFIEGVDPKAMFSGDQINEMLAKINDAHVAEVSAEDVVLMKADRKLGLIFGWAIISKKGGEDYYDLQGDHIPEDAMLEASADFMLNSRTLKLMHKGEKRGTVVFAWPLTTEIAKAMGLRSSVTGLMIAVKPTNKKMLKDVEDGKLTGFSIGGFRIEDEDA
jgi:cation transport regulator ChaB